MTSRVHTAMVLAAGLGTRMRPLTAARPKALVELAGRTLIDRVLDRIGDAAISRAVVNVHHFADQMEAHLRSRAVPRVVLSDERSQLLETGGGIVKALPMLGSGPFLVHNSDAVWIERRDVTRDTTNIARLMAAWDDSAMDALLLLAPTGIMLAYGGRGDFALGTQGRLSRRGDGETVPFVFTGVSLAHARMFDGFAAEPHSLNREWDAALARGRLFGLVADGQWMHVGSPAELTAAERVFEASGTAR